MPERTEDLALRGVLPITIGGEAVNLRTLTLDESDEWLGRLATDLAAVETVPKVDDDDDGSALIAAVFTGSTPAVLRLVEAYDLDGVLPRDLRKRATKRELKDALDAMVTAEDPFGEGGARSVAEVFGAPSRNLAQTLGLLQDGDLLRLLELSTSGPSEPSVSATETSGPDGATNNSSSAGPTRKRKKKST